MPDDTPWTTVLDLAALRVEIRPGSGQPVAQPGNRAAELRLTGGPSGDVHRLTAWTTPSGDDPYPTLEILLHPRPADLVSRLDALDAVLVRR